MPRQQVTLTVEAYEALQTSAAHLGGLVLRRVPMSEALVAIAAVARQHPDELRAALDAGPVTG